MPIAQQFLHDSTYAYVFDDYATFNINSLYLMNSTLNIFTQSILALIIHVHETICSTFALSMEILIEVY